MGTMEQIDGFGHLVITTYTMCIPDAVYAQQGNCKVCFTLLVLARMLVLHSLVKQGCKLLDAV